MEPLFIHNYYTPNRYFVLLKEFIEAHKYTDMIHQILNEYCQWMVIAHIPRYLSVEREEYYEEFEELVSLLGEEKILAIGFTYDYRNDYVTYIYPSIKINYTLDNLRTLKKFYKGIGYPTDYETIFPAIRLCYYGVEETCFFVERNDLLEINRDHYDTARFFGDKTPFYQLSPIPLMECLKDDLIGTKKQDVYRIPALEIEQRKVISQKIASVLNQYCDWLLICHFSSSCRRYGGNDLKLAQQALLEFAPFDPQLFFFRDSDGFFKLGMKVRYSQHVIDKLGVERYQYGEDVDFTTYTKTFFFQGEKLLFDNELKRGYFRVAPNLIDNFEAYKYQRLDALGSVYPNNNKEAYHYHHLIERPLTNISTFESMIYPLLDQYCDHFLLIGSEEIVEDLVKVLQHEVLSKGLADNSLIETESNNALRVRYSRENLMKIQNYFGSTHIIPFIKGLEAMFFYCQKTCLFYSDSVNIKFGILKTSYLPQK